MRKFKIINPVSVYSSFREEIVNLGIPFEKVKLTKNAPPTRFASQGHASRFFGEKAGTPANFIAGLSALISENLYSIRISDDQ